MKQKKIDPREYAPREEIYKTLLALGVPEFYAERSACVVPHFSDKAYRGTVIHLPEAKAEAAKHVRGRLDTLLFNAEMRAKKEAEETEERDRLTVTLEQLTATTTAT